MNANRYEQPAEIRGAQERPTALAVAFRGCVVRRAMILAAIVGTVLVGINHGPCIVSGHFNHSCAIQSGLTFLVPYCVSTVSSVLSYLEQYRT